MGTRNLTAVYLNGEYKIAQYGQWDGYPDGQGLGCLHFLRERCDMPRFRDAVSKTTFITQEELNKLLTEFGMEEDGSISMDDYDRFKLAYPELHRDMASDILEFVQNRPDGARLKNSITFAADGLFCEYAWVIDLDAGTFEGYEGFNKEPLTPEDRFFFLTEYEDKDDPIAGEYHGVKLVAKWPLDNLPADEDFLSAFKGDDEEEQE